MTNQLTTNPHKKISPSTVLVVDDETELLEIIALALEDAGYRCLTASRAADALTTLRREPAIDVIVSDVRMPDMDGFALLRSIRQQFKDRAWLQLLFISAHASIDTIITALRFNAVDFLRKPVRGSQLLDAVAQAANRSHVQKERSRMWDEQRRHFCRLNEEARRLAEAMTDFPPLPPTDERRSVKIPANPQSGGSSGILSRSRLLELLSIRETRMRCFDEKLFADPVMHMAFELMECQLLNRKVTVSDLCATSGLPFSTASRRLTDLETSGYLVRQDDPTDGRRQFVRLTDRGVQRVTAYLTALHAKVGSNEKQAPQGKLLS
ncbi:response regulator [Mesorhizobium retamae]|uniref:Response regulator n=1 Tax=Mesorhizobium retamae TaxID=2912854 RepID=A0ABS9QNI2_9HYPH|nr:response regulator [Mesorhizobium sp. IRAMC:0171]MCG7508989.1 response regulator [Mesorhizobium sp. IRAMC:0171]